MKKKSIINDTLIHTDEDVPIDVYGTHYIVQIYCGNCEQHDSVMIKKGTSRAGLSTTCTNCGCKIKI